MHDIGMIAGDTSRSRAYVQALAKNDLLPNVVLVLAASSGAPMPGQRARDSGSHGAEFVDETEDCWSEAHFDADCPITQTLDECGVQYVRLPGENINDPALVETVRARPESVFIYSGFGGVILRKAVLETGKRFLHVHGGYLPDFKGSTTNYFSLIVENAMGASSIFMSEEIDGGPVLSRRKFPAPTNRVAIDHVYDSGARAKVLIETLKRYSQLGAWEYALPINSGGETYFIIHPVLKHIAILGSANEGSEAAIGSDLPRVK